MICLAYCFLTLALGAALGVTVAALFFAAREDAG